MGVDGSRHVKRPSADGDDAVGGGARRTRFHLPDDLGAGAAGIVLVLFLLTFLAFLADEMGVGSFGVLPGAGFQDHAEGPGARGDGFSTDLASVHPIQPCGAFSEGADVSEGQ